MDQGDKPIDSQSVSSSSEQESNNSNVNEEQEIAPGAKVCGNCRLYKRVLQKEGIWQGECRVMLDRGMFPILAPTCNSYLPKAAPIPKILKTTLRPTERRPVAPLIRTQKQPIDVPIPEMENMTREEMKALIREALMESESNVRLAPKWEGGVVVIKPASGTLQPREMPIDALFHKVVMVRDRLRVLEQKVNAHPKLSDAEKVEMQQYVTKCYGSLTSFNLLFADKDDQFVGEKGKLD